MKLPYDTIIYIIEIILIIYSNSPVSLLLNVSKQYVLGVYIPHILSIKSPIGVVYTTHTLIIFSQWEILTLLIPCSFYRQFMFFTLFINRSSLLPRRRYLPAQELQGELNAHHSS